VYSSEDTGHASMRSKLQDNLKKDAGSWWRRWNFEIGEGEGFEGLRIEGEG